MVRTEKIVAGRATGHVFHAENPRGGVLVLPTIMGVDNFVRGRAEQIASRGMTALVWDPYPGEALPVDNPAGLKRAASLTDDTLDAMSDCTDYLLGSLKLGTAAVVGFCLGGRYALLCAARDKRLAGCVAFYPSIRIPAKPNESQDGIALSRQIECPVHLIHGTGDKVFLHEVFLKLRDALEQRKAATMVQVHPDAVHSFMRPDLQSEPANASATRLSWPPAVTFLEMCVAGARPA